MPTAKRPVLDGTMLRQRLASLRRRLRLVATVRGAGLLLTVLLATAVVAGLLDWLWHLPALVRAVILVATLAGGIVVAYRYLFRPLSAPSDDLSLALRVEEEYPALNDALASTVQFLQRGSPTDSSSAALEREAVKRALGSASGCDFGKVVNKRGLVWAGALGGVFTVLAVTLIVFAPLLARTAFLRLANPFGDIDWPKKTQLEIDEPRLRIGRNEAFEVRGRVHGVIPPQATVVFRFEGFPNLEHFCDIKTDETGVGQLHTRLPAGRVAAQLPLSGEGQRRRQCGISRRSAAAAVADGAGRQTVAAIATVLSRLHRPAVAGIAVAGQGQHRRRRRHRRSAVRARRSPAPARLDRVSTERAGRRTRRRPHAICRRPAVVAACGRRPRRRSPHFHH